ncbi:hypothetical protein WICPIJ_007710 [Wickerhamomyces pijperi]|uniref:Uncharacterized protein n=1 Tax=Wickerhamomyces pijperi TaxID=599730 RepID=A0A9P8Q1A1_WICPI|nr:hypothetical protein WICPIJ_007710 [Wickerhamomyces pijperi]
MYKTLTELLAFSKSKALKATSGKLTAPTEAPSLMYLLKAVPTSTPIADWASSVEPPMCGVKMTFLKETNSEIHGFNSLLNKPAPFLAGSCG